MAGGFIGSRLEQNEGEFQRIKKEQKAAEDILSALHCSFIPG